MGRKKKSCFVIAPIGDDGSEARRRSDQVLKHIIRPAVEKKGYEATRADELAEPGLISSQVIQRVVDDPLVVADLTGRNPNVFYELAIRHSLRMPLVQLIEKGESIPFDVSDMRTIQVDHRDLDSVEEARIEIVRQVETLEKKQAPIETPISVSIDLQVLKSSEKQGDRDLADVLSGIADLRKSISAMAARLGPSSTTLVRGLKRTCLPVDLSYTNYWSDQEVARTFSEILRIVREIESSDKKDEVLEQLERRLTATARRSHSSKISAEDLIPLWLKADK